MQLTATVKQGAISRTMQLLGHRMYVSIWRMSRSLKALPPKTVAVLAVVFKVGGTKWECLIKRERLKFFKI